MAAERGLADALDFTGPLPAQALSDTLARCDVLLFADTVGPTGRKGTLAGELASGRPVVAIDGPLTWRALVEARAARVVAPEAAELAAALGELLGDREERERLGARGRSFYLREMALERTVTVTRELLAEALAGR
jgi:glycosyltransferase involved in cell wall biosynthesis